MNEWKLLFEGDIEGRPVKLSVYPSGEFKVITTQKGEGVFEAGYSILPSVISDGDTIEIDAENADELEQELLNCDFTEFGAKDISRHARNPC